MQKQICKTDCKIIHHSQKRLRLRFSALNEFCDVHNIVSDFNANFSGLFLSVKLSAKSLIITSVDAITTEIAEKIVEFFSTYEPKKLKSLKEKPSTAMIGLSALALANSYSTRPIRVGLVSKVAALPLIKEGAEELIKNGLTSKVLEAAAVGVSLLRRDFRAANSTNLMLNIGEYIEESTVAKSDELVKELARPTVTHAWVEENKELIKKSANDIKVGDIVVVGAGDSIAVDGYIVDGTASVNQVSMTGEAAAVAKTRGDRVLSGTVVVEGKIKIWAESVGENTSTAKIINYMKDCLEERSKIGQKAYRLADSLVPVTFGLATIAYLFKGSAVMASVLQADYSCALKLATPVAFKSAISYAGKRQILLKGSTALENLSNVDTFVFDKTGTLTHGNLKVESVHIFSDKYDEKSLLSLSASAEEHYFHPVAEAIVRAANERGFSHINHGEVEFIVAHGVKTSIDNEEIIIGSRHFLEEDEGVDFSKTNGIIDKLLEKGLTLLYVARAKELLGVIAMKDEIRENAKEILAKLKENGVKELVMLTGDVEKRAVEVAKELGIDRVYADLLPQDKADIISKLRAEGKKVAFIGDGINDAPSLVQADVGISMQKGADLAKISSDIGLLRDDFACVLEAKIIANETMKKIDKNFSTTVWVNSFILGAATLGLLSPTATALAHNGTTIALLANAIKHKEILN